MKTQVSILHQDYPAAAREQVEEKLHGLAKFYQRLVSARALLERVREEHRVEIVANVGHGTVLVADAKETGFSAALDQSLEKMARQLKRHHDKQVERNRKGRRES